MPITNPPVITPAPSPAPQRGDRTTFSNRVDAFLTWLIAAVAQFQSVATNVFNNATDAASSATSASTDKGIVLQAKTDTDGFKFTAQFAADKALEYRNTAKDHRDAAAASAAQVGTANAFSDANPIARNATDSTKQIRFNLANFITNVIRVVTWQDRNGTVAFTDDADIVRYKKYFDAGANLSLNYNDGVHQRWAPGAGSKTLAITNWPAANEHAELMIEGIGLGGATITWPSYIWWMRYDGSYSQSFSYTLATLQGGTASDFVVLWSREGSTRVFGKVVRG